MVKTMQAAVEGVCVVKSYVPNTSFFMWPPTAVICLPIRRDNLAPYLQRFVEMNPKPTAEDKFHK